MSWSFPDRSMPIRPSTIGRALLLGGALAAAPVLAAEYYIQPIVSLTAENDSNLDLEPGPNPQVQGYLADAAALVSVTTQNTSTTLRPRLIYGEYPKDPGDDHLEGYLDINSVYKTQLSSASLTGSIEHEDLFNAAFTPAIYDEINPGQIIVDTGKTTQGSTRDSAILYPRYVYNFTPTIGAGVTGDIQAARYHPTDVTAQVDFDYYQAGAFVQWAFTQLSTVALEGYGTQYHATEFTSRADGAGVSLDFNTQWTPLLSTEETVVAQHTSFDDLLPVPLNTDVTTWGATASAVYKEETSTFRLNAGRVISPWGGGSLYVVNSLQFQYTKNFNSRLAFTGALIGLRTDALTSNIAGDDRKYAQTAVDVKYFVSRTFFVQGGYQYSWQKYQYAPDSAANNRIYIRFGYQGLPVQR